MNNIHCIPSLDPSHSRMGCFLFHRGTLINCRCHPFTPSQSVFTKTTLGGQIESRASCCLSLAYSVHMLSCPICLSRPFSTPLSLSQTQQRELTVRHVKETEKELNRNFTLQKEQYEATIQRHLTFIDQVHTHDPLTLIQNPRLRHHSLL